MGLGNPVDPSPKNRTPNFDHITPLEIEMKICCEYLHCPHKNFTALPFEERLKLLLYEEMQRRRSNDEVKRMNDKHKSPKKDSGPALNGKRK
jgi:hypothetical protein